MEVFVSRTRREPALMHVLVMSRMGLMPWRRLITRAKKRRAHDRFTEPAHKRVSTLCQSADDSCQQWQMQRFLDKLDELIHAQRR